MKKQRGVTLIELMITLVVLSILVAIAAPNFISVIEQNRIKASLQEFSVSLKYARSEAVKRSSSVTICASADQASCTGTWADGWAIFNDIDGVGDLDVGTDTLLRVHDGITDGHSLTFDGSGGMRITFSSRGYAAGQNGTIKMCGKDGNALNARGMILQSTGSLRFSIDSSGNSIYENAAGTDFSC
jgi:type IV fimbrial biogenesis protein FimT